MTDSPHTTPATANGFLPGRRWGPATAADMSTFTEEVLGVLARKADVVGFLMEQEADASMIEYEVIELCDLIRRARGDFYGPESEAAP